MLWMRQKILSWGMDYWLRNWPAWYNIDGSISQNTDEGSGSKAEKRKFQDVSESEGKFCEKVLFFNNRGHLRALNVCDLKLLCPSLTHFSN
jgi:hypothetical protein